jgi:hypothetical protein
MIPTLLAWLRHLSRICGFDTAESFPPGHRYARTRWNGAYFDIASDVKPEQIERRLSEAIANTPQVFGYITNPTPLMQRALTGAIEERQRRRVRSGDLVLMLIEACRSPHSHEGVPGLRAAIRDSDHLDSDDQVRAILDFLARLPSNDIIDSDTRVSNVIAFQRRH